jgi:hypothetical protein
MLLSQERCMGIVDRSEKPPPTPTPTKEEFDEDGKPIHVAGTSSARAYTEYTWRYWGALWLIHGSLEESVQNNYMSIQDPAELWDSINSDCVKKLQKWQYYVREALYCVKLTECGSVEAYVTTIQNLLDQYKLGAKEDDDKIGVREHVFYLLHGIPQGEDWDHGRRFIHQRLDEDDWCKKPDKIIQNLKDREAELRNIKQLSADVALYTKLTSQDTKKGKPEVKKDKAKRVCTYWEKEGHLEDKCWTKHGKPYWKEKDKNKKEDKDKKSSIATANLTSTSTIDSLWMAVEDSAVTMRDFYLDCACDAHACNRRDLFDSEMFVEIKEGDRKVRGFDGSPQSAKGIGTIRCSLRKA